MCLVFLIRHASVDGLGTRIAGRQKNIHLNEMGKKQALQLADRLAEIPMQAIYSSPLERAMETAEVIAQTRGVGVKPEDDLNEIDYGAWTGKELHELDVLPDWHKFNWCRSTAQIPEGENMQQVSKRAMRAIIGIQQRHLDGKVAVVSHADWIRAAAAESIGASINALRHFDVAPASLSILRVEDWGCEILRWNDTGKLPLPV